MPLDQRADDGCSLCFDSAPLADRLELLGGAEVELTIAADAPEAMLAVRLNDVSPDGVSRRVAYGLANLALDDAYEATAAARSRATYHRPDQAQRRGLRGSGGASAAGRRLDVLLAARLAVAKACGSHVAQRVNHSAPASSRSGAQSRARPRGTSRRPSRCPLTYSSNPSADVSRSSATWTRDALR